MTAEPTILGPYGEGYCRYCRFVEGLDQYGLLNSHIRGALGRSYTEDPKPCKGSSRKPAKVTPYMSRLSVFVTRPRKVDCPQCGARVQLVTGTGYQYLERHMVNHSLVVCGGTSTIWQG